MRERKTAISLFNVDSSRHATNLLSPAINPNSDQNETVREIDALIYEINELLKK